MIVIYLATSDGMFYLFTYISLKQKYQMVDYINDLFLFFSLYEFVEISVAINDEFVYCE